MITHFVGTVSEFGRESIDRNGLQAAYITPVAGKCPNKAQTQSGSVAKRLGVEYGKSYLFMARELEPDEQYGRQFNLTKIKEADTSDIVTALHEFGQPYVIDVGADATVQSKQQETAETKVGTQEV